MGCIEEYEQTTYMVVWIRGLCCHFQSAEHLKECLAADSWYRLLGISLFIKLWITWPSLMMTEQATDPGAS